MTDTAPRTLTPDPSAPLDRKGLDAARIVNTVVMLAALVFPGVVAIEADITTAVQNSILAVNSIAGVVTLVLGILKRDSVTPIADPVTTT